MYRKTYAEINHDNIKENIEEIRAKYPEYKYYIGVVKNNAYHHGIKIVNALKEGGINYFAVSSLEEALDLRKYDINTPILILEPIDLEYVYDCINNNITITIESLQDAKMLNTMDFSYKLKVHLKLDTGMNRLGFKNKQELEKTVEILKNNDKIFVEGIYSHFATSGTIDKYWDKQLNRFKELTENIDLKSIPIVHLGRSLTLVNHPQINFCNGIRLGIIMYGFSQSRKKERGLKARLREIKNQSLKKKYDISATTLENDLNLKTAFSLYSTVISIREIQENEFVGYNAAFIAKEKGFIATIPIGYADGVDKRFQHVWINEKKYPIIGDTMDMIMVLVDNKITEGMKVEIFGENITINEVTKNIGQNAYHLFNMIQNRVPRIHKTKEENDEIKY